ncbi:hypothetical protein [Salinibacillus xinjiangensis]|uniref:hypothetical protein n=1 Tax=Salinibacillus xinjiangensis TaxID=1229268 RepID=UPI002B27149B|nr:hypothetical protein [Salinibacillus xinjiangensis]
MKSLNGVTSKLTEKHKKLANQLLLAHNNTFPFKQIPAYEYDQLRKRISCSKCHLFSVSDEKTKCVCHDCGYEEPATSAVIRSVKEFKLLFPNEKITTKIIHDWCQVVQSKKRIRRILTSNFKIVGVHQWAYYE